MVRGRGLGILSKGMTCLDFHFGTEQIGGSVQDGLEGDKRQDNGLGAC